MIDILIEDARNFQKCGQYDLAIDSLKKAQKINSQCESFIEVEKLLSFNYRKLGEYTLALFHINKALNRLRTQNKKEESREYAICLMNKGVIYEEMGKSTQAIECYLPALKILIGLYNSSPENFGIIINALLTVGFLYYDQQQYSMAKEFFEQAIPYFGSEKETDRRYVKIMELLKEIAS